MDTPPIVVAMDTPPIVVAMDTPPIVVAMDWTDFDADDQATLVLSLVTNHGRATPLLWLSVCRPKPAWGVVSVARRPERARAAVRHSPGSSTPGMDLLLLPAGQITADQ
ncbi:MAG: hypothetical protein H7840_16430 [Alphaproteobacteria bacterium]